MTLSAVVHVSELTTTVAVSTLTVFVSIYVAIVASATVYL